MARHSTQVGAQVHEEKYIGVAVPADAGKVVTPSAVAGVGELRKLASTELSDTSSIVRTSGAQAISGKTFTTTRVVPMVVALTDAATIAVDADLTDVGTVTLTDNRTLGAPTGTPVDGQLLYIRVRQDGTGTRTLAYNAIYRFTAASAPAVTATANETSYLTFMYHSADVKWDCIGTTLDIRT